MSEDTVEIDPDVSELDDLEIPDYFAEWIRAAELLNGDVTRLKQRWAGVEQIIDDISLDQVDQLIHYVFQGKPGKTPLKWFQDVFKEFDPMFTMTESNNRNELITLAAAVLAYSLEERDTDASEYGCRVLSASCSNTRTAGGSAPIIELAQNAIASYAVQSRKRPNSQPTQTSLLTDTEVEKVFESAADNNPATILTATKNLAKLMQKKSQSIFNKFNVSMNTMNDYIKVQDEEIDLLWWLTNGYSETLDCKFVDLDEGIKAFTLGTEVAEASFHHIELPNLKSLLIRAGVASGKKLSLKKLMTEIGNNISTLGTEKNTCPIITPLHHALTCACDQGLDGWQKKWERDTELSVEINMNALEWAFQAHRERLILIKNKKSNES